MSVRKVCFRVGSAAAFLSVLYAFQRPFRQYPGVEYRKLEVTPDWEEKTEWGLTPAQGKVLREYLLRGGFFMADDFHGTEEWQVFQDSMKLVFPDRPIVEIESKDPIFH